MGFFGIPYIRGDNSVEGFLGDNKSIEKRTHDEVRGIINLLKLDRESRILDVPVGYGRHSIEFADIGYDVTGYDINQIHLQEAALRATDTFYHTDGRILSVAQKIGAETGEIIEPEPAKLQLKYQNMLDMNDEKEYDALINMFYSFGFFDDEKDNIRAMQNFYNALKDGGQFLLHTDVSPEMIEARTYCDIGTTVRHLKPTRIHVKNKTFPPAELHLTERYDEETSRITGTWKIIENDDTVSDDNDYSMRIYTAEEFRTICHDVGFNKVDILSDWSGSLFTGKEPLMIVHATR